MNATTLIVCLILSAAPTADLPPATTRFGGQELSRGVGLFEQHEFEKATRIFLADLRVNATNVEALLYLGRIAFEENRFDSAETLFDRVVKLAPSNSVGFLCLGRLYGIQARALGAPRGIGAAIRARKNLEKAVELDPHNLDARADLAAFYREAPALVGGSSRAARSQVAEIARRDPYRGALGRGDLALADRHYEEAEREYEGAVRLRPGGADAHFRLGLLHERTQHYGRALAAFRKVLELDPERKAAWFEIGKTADLSGEGLDEGEAALKTYLQCRPFFIMPKLARAHRRLGNIYVRKGSLDAAREQYLAALRLDPHDQEAARALKQLGTPGTPPK